MWIDLVNTLKDIVDPLPVGCGQAAGELSGEFGFRPVAHLGKLRLARGRGAAIRT
jgi:hypothetical protein